MTEPWKVCEVFDEQASAESLAGRLRDEGVPVRIDVRAPIPGLQESVRVLVPENLAHRARWLMAQSDATDGELAYMATGELSGDDSNSGELATAARSTVNLVMLSLILGVVIALVLMFVLTSAA